MIDKETIGRAFEYAVSDIDAPTYLAEAESDEYPYIVYNQNIITVRTKDGVQAYSSNLTATIYAADPNTAEDLAEDVAYAVSHYMTSYSVFPETLNRNCTNGIWEFELTWIIRQMEDSAVPGGSGSGSGSSDGQSA